MLRMLGLPTAILALLDRRGLLGARDRTQHVAESGDQADHQEREHEPRLGAESAIEPHAEEQAHDYGDAELEPDRARGQRVVRALAAARGRIDAGVHGLSMRLLHL